MNENQNENQTSVSETEPQKRRRHPYTMSNTTEETLRRMRAFPERLAKFKKELEQLDADRKTHQS